MFVWEYSSFNHQLFTNHLTISAGYPKCFPTVVQVLLSWGSKQNRKHVRPIWIRTKVPNHFRLRKVQQKSRALTPFLYHLLWRRGSPTGTVHPCSSSFEAPVSRKVNENCRKPNCPNLGDTLEHLQCTCLLTRKIASYGFLRHILSDRASSEQVLLNQGLQHRRKTPPISHSERIFARVKTAGQQYDQCWHSV